jgi:hypothetical protein
MNTSFNVNSRNFSATKGHMINRAKLLQELARQAQQRSQQPGPIAPSSESASPVCEQQNHLEASGSSFSAQSTSCLGTTANANFQAGSVGTDLTVRSHRGNNANFSTGPGGTRLSITPNADRDRPSFSDFQAAFQANFGF